MERQDVDRAALAPDRERDLDLDDPAPPNEQCHDRVDQRRVGFVDQPIELFAAPPQLEVHVGAERPGRTNQRSDRHAADLASIDGCDQRAREARVAGDIHLASLVAHAERPELTTEPEPIHPDIVIDVPLLAVTAGARAVRPGRTVPPI